jgi:hypothetical protein
MVDKSMNLKIFFIGFSKSLGYERPEFKNYNKKYLE